MESIRSELLQLQQTCRCLRTGGEKEEKEVSRKRPCEALNAEEERGPEKKRGERRRRRDVDFQCRVFI